MKKILFLFLLVFCGQAADDVKVNKRKKKKIFVDINKRHLEGYNQDLELKYELVWRDLNVANVGSIAFHPTRPYLVFVTDRSGFLYSFTLNYKKNIEKRKILDLSEFANEIVSEGIGNYNGGIVGMALDPDFLTNGYVYINFVSKGNSVQSILCRFRINPLLPREISFLERVEFIFYVTYPNASPTGGDIVFGLDGYLYISVGSSNALVYKKGGKINSDSPNDAQDRTNFLGSILRIDPRTPQPFKQYSFPKGNPFYNKKSQEKDFLPEIYAYGFRSPTSLNFNQKTGDFSVIDEGSGLMDEVNLIEKGNNYGWFYREGTKGLASDLNSKNFSPPIFAREGKYITGKNLEISSGVMYHGYLLKGLSGAYIFTDKLNREIYAIKIKDGKVIKKYYLGRTPTPFVRLIVNPSSEEIYAVSKKGIYLLKDIIGDPIALIELEE